mmetsp:Transcript_36026/g.78603  ORF Transcript_36026/g.78603 Transcript_36026/m.78603 type:complete len:213 (-) Transcript_36026:351-989(-)
MAATTPSSCSAFAPRSSAFSLRSSTNRVEVASSFSNCSSFAAASVFMSAMVFDAALSFTSMSWLRSSSSLMRCSSEWILVSASKTCCRKLSASSEATLRCSSSVSDFWVSSWSSQSLWCFRRSFSCSRRACMASAARCARCASLRRPSISLRSSASLRILSKYDLIVEFFSASSSVLCSLRCNRSRLEVCNSRISTLWCSFPRCNSTSFKFN